MDREFDFVFNENFGPALDFENLMVNTEHGVFAGGQRPSHQKLKAAQRKNS